MKQGISTIYKVSKNSKMEIQMKLKSFLPGIILIVSLTACASTPESQNKTTVSEPETKVEQVKKTPDVIFVEQLQDYLTKDDIEGAINHFDSIPTSLKENTDMLLLKASLLISTKRIDEATEITNSILEKDPSNKDALEVTAQIALVSRNSTAQAAAFKKILAADPNNSAANVFLGDQYQTKKKYKLALNYYKKALEGEPNHRDALMGYGKMCWYTDDLKSAKSAFLKVIEHNPNDALAYSFLAKLEAEDERYKTAIEYVSTAIKLSPNTYDFHLDLGTFMRNIGKFSEAEKAWTMAISLEPDYFLGYAYRAGLYDEQNKIKEALADYHMVVKTNPNYYFAYEEIGILEFHEKNWAVARQAFAKANSIKNQTAYQLMIIATYIREKNMFEAKKYADLAMKPIQDKNSLDCKLIRLFKDQGPVNAENSIALQLEKETDKNKKGKMTYYFGLYYEMKGSDKIAKEYYSKITSMQSPMFFEYRLAEWGIQDL